MGARSIALNNRPFLGRLFINNSISNIVFNIIYINQTQETIDMNLLNLQELKSVLTVIASNPTALTVQYPDLRNKNNGKIVIPADARPEARFAINMIIREKPQLITKLENEVLLSLEGQILLDLLSDDARIETIRNELKSKGHTEPTDRQIYKRLRDDLTSSDTEQKPITLFVSQSNQTDEIKTIEVIDEVKPMLPSNEPILPSAELPNLDNASPVDKPVDNLSTETAQPVNKLPKSVKK